MRGFVGFGVTSAVTLLAMVQLPAIFDSLDQALQTLLRQVCVDDVIDESLFVMYRYR